MPPLDRSEVAHLPTLTQVLSHPDLRRLTASLTPLETSVSPLAIEHVLPVLIICRSDYRSCDHRWSSTETS